ncbi:MAG TPA: sigma-70 family RNA polymerase sigma factor [Solirubrobacterales bacterium]|nr:sigma-70 family RNA polymerase sigma factor [Solirubrobacterales bacterium]
MTTETLYLAHSPGLTRRLERMLGSREAAEDVAQEAFLRLWRRAPGDLEPDQQVAWLRRTASNLAIDELRRRKRRDHVDLDEEAVEAIAADGAESLAVRDALDRLSAHERLCVLLRFQAGLSYGQIAETLAITPEAARKRVSRARRSFAAAYRGARASDRPLILLEPRHEPGRYLRWLDDAGAEVRLVRPGPIEPQLAVADAIVISGSVNDLHPALYGERPRVRLNAPDPARDAREMRVTRAALDASLPLLGICGGAQLMNIALGGSLYQDIQADGAAGRSHWGVQHRIETRPGTLARRILGRGGEVSSEHHQAARRIGGGLRGTSRSDDSIFESLELGGQRFALGLQWHPEDAESGTAGLRMGEALVSAARDHAAAGGVRS